MKLADLLNDEVTTEASATNVSNTMQPSTLETSSSEVEKIASTLDALSEEDTLLDELAKLAVIADLLDPEKRSANA
jgi:hypothetical protein